MDRSHHIVETRLATFGDIESTIGEDVGLQALDDPQVRIGRIPGVGPSPLFPQSRRVDPVGIERRGRVIGHAEERPPPMGRRLGHFLQRCRAVRIGGVVVENPFDIVEFDQIGKDRSGRRLQPFRFVPQLRWDPLKSEAGKNLRLAGTGEAPTTAGRVCPLLRHRRNECITSRGENHRGPGRLRGRKPEANRQPVASTAQPLTTGDLLRLTH